MPTIRIARDGQTRSRIWDFRDEHFAAYPQASTRNNDHWDENAIVLYSENAQRNIIATARVVFDGPNGLPADAILPTRTRANLRRTGPIAEISKLAIAPGHQDLLRQYIRQFHHIARRRRIQTLLFICLAESVPVYRRLVGAKTIEPDIGHDYGCGEAFSLLTWDIHATETAMEVEE